VENYTRPVAGNPATPEAVAALRAHPGFAAAMRTSAAGIVALYQGGRLINWLMDDRGRLLFGYFALYLHFTRDPVDPTSGLTPTNIKAICKELAICSPGRANVMLSLMRFGGYLERDPEVADRRHRRLIATERLTSLLTQRWKLHLTAMAPLLPDGADICAKLDDAKFMRHLMLAMVMRLRSGFRFLEHSDELRLFGERSAGMLILAALATSGTSDDTMPPTRPVSVSISALARRFSVSRAHVLKLLRDAEADGMIERSGEGGERIVVTPALAYNLQNFFATMFLFFADCARRAMIEIGQSDRAD
jgi:DNA-binding MarR family transcriptional regulator